MVGPRGLPTKPRTGSSEANPGSYHLENKRVKAFSIQIGIRANTRQEFRRQKAPADSSGTQTGPDVTTPVAGCSARMWARRRNLLRDDGPRRLATEQKLAHKSVDEGTKPGDGLT